jgi:TonB family protein
MNTIQRTKEFIIIAFLLSLLFHTSSIIYVIWQRTDNPAQSLQKKEEDLKQEFQKKKEWVETKARAGNFGAPVLFQDEPFHADKSVLNEPANQEPQENKQKNSEETIIKEAIAKKESVSLKTSDIAQTKPFFTKSEIKKQPLQQKQSHTKTTKKTTSSQQKKEVLLPPKPPLSLAQLTQGFLHHVKDEGKHAIHMLGKKTGMPSDEQIKYERYLQKINWCLQNSFNINQHQLLLPSTAEYNSHIRFSLNKNGTLTHCSIAKSSGNHQLDQFILFIFKDASTSFPPIPTYLPHDSFTLTYVITLNTIEQNGMRIYTK